MGVALFVVKNSALLDRLLSRGEADGDGAVRRWLRTFHRQFEGVEQAACVPSCNIHEVVGSIRIQHDRAFAVTPFWVCECSLQKLMEVFGL